MQKLLQLIKDYLRIESANSYGKIFEYINNNANLVELHLSEGYGENVFIIDTSDVTKNGILAILEENNKIIIKRILFDAK